MRRQIVWKVARAAYIEPFIYAVKSEKEDNVLDNPF